MVNQCSSSNLQNQFCMNAKNIQSTLQLDTCGHAPTERYKEIKDYVDLFLFDYKETDSKKHKIYTGVNNNLILKNLDMLYKSGAEIILRCPIIPGMNDTESHFDGINQIHKKYPNIKKIHIMPYHNMGIDKAKRIRKENNFIELETVSKEKALEWVNHLVKLGCNNVSIG